ncbi:MAG: hydrogenase [Planctomycetota bacterium]
MHIPNGGSVPRADVPVLSFREFRESVILAVERGARVAAFFGTPADADAIRLTAVVAHADAGDFSVVATDVAGRYPSLTPDCPQVHLFERDIQEQWGIRPEGHPWPKPVCFAPPRRGSTPTEPILPGVTDYFRVEGEEIHEVAVGPVHAGVIEPGHFRFQCHGERVLHLEISLGYQHRGIERALTGGPGPRSIHYMETLAGDTTIGHVTAYCQIMEALGGGAVPARAEALRGAALELERLANHTGDLGALAGDVGFLPTLSFCGRLRGDFLNLTAMLCGSRFGRGLVRPGSVLFDLDEARVGKLLDRLGETARDVAGAAELLWNTPSVLARFEDTGAVSRETAEALGLVGVAARASGLERDARFDFPAGIYRTAQIPVSSWQSGDVFARAWVRWLEIQRSVEFLREQLRALPEGPVTAPCGPAAPDRIALAMVEGWRGEICHVALTGADGRFERYAVVDPSFHNWTGLAMALRNEEISDFPLCNKSFNLSYAGHDR